MPLNFEYLAAAGPIAADGVFIPVGDLPGVLAAELGEAAAESKAVYGLLNKIYEIISPAGFSSLGVAVSKANPIGSGNDLISQSYGMTLQYQVDHGTNTLSPIPVPTTGANAEVGKVGILDLFPSAMKVAAGPMVEAGVLIPSGDLALYGAPSHAALAIGGGADNRNWLASLINYLAVETPARSADTATAITAKSRSAATGFTPTGALVAETDPTSGIDPAALGRLSFLQQNYSFTVQLLLDPETQTFDVNHATV